MGFRLSILRPFLLLQSALAAFALPLSAQSPSPPMAPGAVDLSNPTSGIGPGSFRSRLRPVAEVSLSARAAGIVEVIRVPEGTAVKAGQAIMSLDSNQESADVAQAEAFLRGAKAEMDRATTELERNERLRQDNIYSEKQLQDAKAQAEIARSKYEQAQASLEGARVRLTNRDIVSPIDGIFLKTNKHVGEAVERYETVARVVDVTSLEMEVFCDAKYFSLFQPGQKVDVRVLKSADDQPMVSGTVSYVDPIVDYTGLFRVRVKLEHSAQAVPGFPAILIAPNR